MKVRISLLEALTLAELGPRPSDPKRICFDPECFVKDGETVTYAVMTGYGVVSGSQLGGPPRTFSSLADAEAWARKIRGRVV